MGGKNLKLPTPDPKPRVLPQGLRSTITLDYRVVDGLPPPLYR